MSIRVINICGGVNTYLQRVFRDLLLGLPSYRLPFLEEKFGVARSEKSYKANIFKLVEDWNNPYKKQKVLKYNEEDMMNLVRLWGIVFSEKGITEQVFS